MAWQDISVPIRHGMVTFEGDPEVILERVMVMADGGPARAILRRRSE
jgi:kynurenine formamidase